MPEDLRSCWPVEDAELGWFSAERSAKLPKRVVKTRQSTGFVLAAVLLARRIIGYYSPTLAKLSIKRATGRLFGPRDRAKAWLKPGLCSRGPAGRRILKSPEVS